MSKTPTDYSTCVYKGLPTAEKTIPCRKQGACEHKVREEKIHGQWVCKYRPSTKTKACPTCGHTVSVSTIRCPYCSSKV